jgi:hypothetical protein
MFISSAGRSPHKEPVDAGNDAGKPWRLLFDGQASFYFFNAERVCFGTDVRFGLPAWAGVDSRPINKAQKLGSLRPHTAPQLNPGNPAARDRHAFMQQIHMAATARHRAGSARQ